MSKYASFDELAERARTSVEGMKMRDGFYEGVKQQITDPYTDNAHFILELLQNAEDMKAKTVRFHLEDDCLYFEHNGTKRDFNLDDIDAITSISNNVQKQNDDDVIGKFGIGFKAVFLYTNTPVIHSGEYHFKIIDLFIPSKEGVETKETIIGGVHWTKFELPFNADTKSPGECFMEINEALHKLDYSSLLFLRSINRIEISAGGENYALIKEEEPFANQSCILRIGKEGDAKQTWLRFTKEFEYNEKGAIKRLPISIAYHYENDEEGKTVFLPLKDGKNVYIFFPAEKENSGLRFPINGPFITSSARNALKTQNEINKTIINEITDLVATSFRLLKEKDWLNPSFLNLMPNSKDNVNGDYAVIYENIRNAFTNEELVPAYEGGYVKGSSASMWTRENMAVLTDEDMAKLNLYENLLTVAGNHKEYCAGPHGYRELQITSKYWRGDKSPQKKWVPTFGASERIMTFYEDINVLNVGTGIHDAFNLPIPNLDQWIQTQTKRKIASFYLLLSRMAKSSTERYPNNSVALDIEGLVRPSDAITWVKDKNIPFKTISHILDPYFITESEELKKEEANKIFTFITENLEIKEFSDLEEMRSIVSEMNEMSEPDEPYFEKLEILLLYFDDLYSRYDHNDVLDVYSKLRFLSDDGSFRNQCEISLGMTYGNESNELFARKLRQIGLPAPLLSEIYVNSERVDAKVLRRLLGLLKLPNVLEIRKSNNYWEYPLRKDFPKGKRTSGEFFEDHVIDRLDQLLALEDVELDCKLMKFLLSIDRNIQEKCAFASYRPNARADIWKNDSSIVYSLRKHKWLLGRDGCLHKPSELFVSDIDESFCIDESSPIIKSLKIGSDLDAEAKRQKEAREILESKGFSIIDQEEKEEFEQFKRMRAARIERKRKSYDEALRDQSSGGQSPYEYYDDEPELYGGVSNLERRQHSLEQELGEDERQPAVPRVSLSERPKISEEEKNTLRQWYGGKCQICGTIIKKKNGEPYFEATNIVPTNLLLDEYDQHHDLCWNSLCLCPNCSAKYKVSQKNVTSLETIAETDFDFTEDDTHELPIDLAGERVYIGFASKHLQAIQVAQKKFQNK